MSDLWSAFVGLLPDYWRSAGDLAAGFDTRNKFSRVAHALTLDARGTDARGLAVIALALAAWIYEWGPLNEMVAAILSLHVLESTASPFAAGVAGGLAYASQQVLVGLITVLAIREMAGGLSAIREALNSDGSSGANVVDRSLLLLGLGASALIVNEHARESGRAFRKDLSLLATALVVLGLVDIAVFYVATAAINGVGNEEVQSELINLATNPISYVAAFVGIKVLAFYRRLSHAGPGAETHCHEIPANGPDEEPYQAPSLGSPDPDAARS